MDLRHLEYIVAIAEEKNISRAADKLFITQPTLSQYLLKIEDDLGLPLFNRSKNLMIVTYAGKIYVETAKEILNISKRADSMFADIIGLKKGNIRFGIAQERGPVVLPAVFPMFREKYPGIDIELIQNNARVLETLTLQGHIDIALLSRIEDKIELSYESLCKEEFILAVPKTHKYAHLASEVPEGRRAVIDISMFKDDPFILMRLPNKIRKIADNIFEDAGIKPNIILETDSVLTAFSIATNSRALSIIPETMLTHTSAPDYVYFSINHEKYFFELIAAYRKDAYITRAMHDFIDMMKCYLKSITSFNSD